MVYLMEQNKESKKFEFFISKSNKFYHIEEYYIGDFYQNLVYDLSRLNKKTITIYFCDLNNLLNIYNKYPQYFSNLIVETFTYNNICYSIRLKDLIYPYINIQIKDYYNFVAFDTTNTQLHLLKNKANNIHKLIHAIYNSFNININTKTILSLTSIAHKIFKKISPKEHRLIIKLNTKEDTYIRKSFFGGRTEIYDPLPLTTEPLYYYDVNSLYPFIMKNYPLPIGIPKYRKGKDILIENFYGFIDVQVQINENQYLPVLPIRSLENHKDMGILYPTGNFRGIYFSEELKLALQKGYKIIKIYDGYEFDKIILFDNFVNQIYTLRVGCEDNFFKKIYKLLMNSLYGKFASIYIKETINLTMKTENFIGIKIKYYSVAISSAITANARCHMYNLLGGLTTQLIYWDTDGFFTTMLMTNIGTELGQLKLIGIINELVCVGTKFYMYKINDNYTYVFRGIRVSDFLLSGATLMRTFKTILQSKFSDKKKIAFILNLKTITGVDKELQFIFANKRLLITKNNFIVTKPWHIQGQQP